MIEPQAHELEDIGTLAGGVAHDFNNLLMVIRGFSEMLLLDGATERGRPKVQQIIAAVERGAALTRQLLASSRQSVRPPRIVDANQILGTMQSMLERLTGEHIASTLRLATEPSPVRIDPAELERVVLNLAANARDAMPGGGALIIATSKVRLDPIECRCHPDAHPGDYVSISFSDSGLGMDRGTLARIFEPFFTTKAPGQGTGLGLTIAHSIVRQNGGFLTVDSEPGRGSVFTIHLPAVLASSKRPVRGTLRPMACGPETALAV